MSQPNFILEIYSKIIPVHMDTSTSNIFGLQPFIPYNEIHLKLIFLQKKQPLFYNDSCYFIISDIKDFESRPFKEKLKNALRLSYSHEISFINNEGNLNNALNFFNFAIMIAVF